MPILFFNINIHITASISPAILIKAPCHIYGIPSFITVVPLFTYVRLFFFSILCEALNISWYAIDVLVLSLSEVIII